MKMLYVLLTYWLGLPPATPPRHTITRIDSLRRELTTATADTGRVLLLAQLAYEHTQTNPMATIAYGKQALQLAQRLQYRHGESLALIRMGSGFREAGNYPAALEVGLQGLKLAETLREPELIGRGLNALGYLYWEQGYSRPALSYFLKARAVAEKSGNTKLLTRVMGNIGNAYQQLHRLDSALLYSQQGYALDLANHDLVSEVGDAAMLGNIYSEMGRPEVARQFYRSSIRRSQSEHITFAMCRANLGLARLWQQQRGPRSDSAIYFGLQALATGQQSNYPKGVLDASKFLAAAFAARRDSARAFRYLSLASATRDTLFSQTRMTQLQALDVNEKLRQRELADQRAVIRQERQQLWLLAALASALPILGLLWRNNRHKQRANQQLNAQNAQIASQRDDLSQTLTQLKDTQAQLVQSEKMAFLGELTAGIAHELQNPLAFMKNFAEVSSVLVDDITTDAPHAARDVDQETLIAGLRQNLQEISQHGQRATSIIAGMLARSRNGSSHCKPTDVNALVEEYFRLAYQGLRAKDPTFRALRATQLAPSLGLVPAVAPDLGRVVLNLCTNAFYAVQQRRQTALAHYAPEVRVSTQRLASGRVEIKVYDNGTGIPEAVRADIFKPFFTTKPSTEGTGLGLSLAHDIIAKGHGGTLTVHSQEGEYTEFIICLPG